MKVFCYNADCLYCKYGIECGKEDIITVGDDCCFGCKDYCCYLDTPEYQSEYYKRVKCLDGNIYKRKSYGKRIEYKKLVFYTGSHPNSIVVVTEEKTGLLAGQLIDIERRYDRIVEICKDISDVRELPDEPEGEGE